MIKRTFLALAFLAGMLSPAFAAGTISLSLMQQFGTDNKPLNGGLLYFYAAGTTTPQNAFQDSGLTIPWPNPLTLGSTGRVPQLFFADGQIKVRLTNSAGVVQLAADNLLVVGPSGGGGGGGSVDPTTVLSTGDTKCKYGTGVLTGFIRWNGRTIGSATSGATERANADAQALFEYLWSTDANLVVSTGRGASANADWVANKTITLPDGRGRVWAMLDDMGNTSAARIASVFTSGSNIVLGAANGSPDKTLALSNLPNVVPSFTGISTPVSVTSVDGGIANGALFNGLSTGGGGTLFSAFNQGSLTVGFRTATGSVVPQGSVGSINGGATQTAFSMLPPTILTTCYGKL
jgi:hypothetical protein